MFSCYWQPLVVSVSTCTAGPAVCPVARPPRPRVHGRVPSVLFCARCSLLFTLTCSYAAAALCSAGTITPVDTVHVTAKCPNRPQEQEGYAAHTLTRLCPPVTPLGFWCSQCVNAFQMCVLFPMLLLYPYAVHNVSAAWREHSQYLHQLVG